MFHKNRYKEKQINKKIEKKKTWLVSLKTTSNSSLQLLKNKKIYLTIRKYNIVFCS